jgi:3-oxoacyl-[acyl-carrier protein] reductase/pteridine reductase
MATPKSLAGKVALVTGGAKRLGRASALALASSGADVAITFLTSKKEAASTVRAIRLAGVRSMALRCDVGDPVQVRAAVEKVRVELGGIDILVNNAGAYETVAFERISVEQWDAIFRVNARGPFLVSQAALSELRRRRGRIINLGSLGARRPWPTHAHYCASKAALDMLTRVMAKALAPDIAVNSVAPGIIDLGEKSAAEFFKRMADKTPMGVNGKAEDVSEAVVFFATASRFITGQMLFVDGGLGL